MASPHGVLFQRDEDGDSDAWDDTVLIKAYDNAVSAMKAKLAAQHPEYATGGASKKKRKLKQKKKKNNVCKSTTTWKVGDFCQAIYTEDGEVYSGQILSVDDENETCVVRYVGYGNEEEQSLDALLPALSEPSSQDNKTDTASEVDSIYEVPKDKQQSGNHKPKRGSHVGGHSSKSNIPPWSWNNFAVPRPPPPAAHHFPSFPHPSHFPPSGFGASPQIPPMFPGIPPPPPMFNGQGDSNENEALYSMLISWYMSGYHTGYYQGLKTAKSSLLNSNFR